MYVLLDANVTAGYYLTRSLRSKFATERIANIFDSVRTGESDLFFYIPNFCEGARIHRAPEREPRAAPVEELQGMLDAVEKAS